MKSQYFCAYHANKIAACESEAFRSWSQMMHRGVKAYVECRIEAAEIYLGSALDVGLLRAACSCNRIFSEEHILKPAEFILQILLMTDDFCKAQNTLRHISEFHKPGNVVDGAVCEKFLADQIERIEVAEKAFFGVGTKLSHSSLLRPKTAPQLDIH